MTQGSLNLKPNGEGFLLTGTDGQQTFEMQLPLQALHGLSLSLSELLSRHHIQQNQGKDQPPLLDIVSPNFSVSSSRMGVELTISGHGLAPIKMTFPIVQSISLVKSLMDETERFAVSQLAEGAENDAVVAFSNPV